MMHGQKNIKLLYLKIDTHLWLYLAVLFRMRNVSNESCRGNWNTHFVFSKVLFIYFSKSCHLWECGKNIEPDRPQLAVWRMRIACWIPKATNTHSQYVIFIAYPLQQWLHERSSMSRYTYIGCLVCYLPFRYFFHICRISAILGNLMWFWPFIVVNMWK